MGGTANTTSATPDWLAQPTERHTHAMGVDRDEAEGWILLRRRWRWLGLQLLMLLALSSCTFKMTGADSVDEFQAEEAYLARYQGLATSVLETFQAFAPRQGSPGVCNIGGTKQECYEADLATIKALDEMHAGMSVIAVPPRFVRGHDLLLQALQINRDGLDSRNATIASGDPKASLAPSNQLLKEALDLYSQSYLAYPADNKPSPSLAG